MATPESEITVTSSSRNALHLGLLLPIVAGLGVGVFLFAKSIDYRISDLSFPAAANSAWSRIVHAVPAPMPGEYPEEDDSAGPESSDDLSPEDERIYAESNAFMVSCTLLVLLGCIGISILGAGTRLQDPWWNSFLRSGTIISIALISFLLWGFSVAFAMDHFGIFPLFSFGFPGTVDPVEYGLGGMSEWTDLIYLASYAAFIGCLLVSFVKAGQSAASSLLIAAPVISILFPLVVSWKWGAGWIEQLNNNSDFAGAALVHWHVGALALLIGGVLTFLRKSGKFGEMTMPSPTAYLIGGAFYFAGIVGLNAGSVLSAAPDLVACVIQSTAIAASASAFVAGIWWAIIREGGATGYLVMGFIAGAVGVSGAADSFNQNQSLTIGVVTGICVSGTLFVFQRLKWADPLGVGAVHGVGGIIAIFATCFVTSETDPVTSFPGQLVLFVAVPFFSLGLTSLILLLAGATGLLFHEKKPNPAPPSLPGTS
jgi:Amt family ammonium transporter